MAYYPASAVVLWTSIQAQVPCCQLIKAFSCLPLFCMRFAGIARVNQIISIYELYQSTYYIHELYTLVTLLYTIHFISHNTTLSQPCWPSLGWRERSHHCTTLYHRPGLTAPLSWVSHDLRQSGVMHLSNPNHMAKLTRMGIQIVACIQHGQCIVDKYVLQY